MRAGGVTEDGPALGRERGKGAIRGGGALDRGSRPVSRLRDARDCRTAGGIVVLGLLCVTALILCLSMGHRCLGPRHFTFSSSIGWPICYQRLGQNTNASATPTRRCPATEAPQTTVVGRARSRRAISACVPPTRRSGPARPCAVFRQTPPGPPRRSAARAAGWPGGATRPGGLVAEGVLLQFRQRFGHAFQRRTVSHVVAWVAEQLHDYEQVGRIAAKAVGLGWHRPRVWLARSSPSWKRHSSTGHHGASLVEKHPGNGRPKARSEPNEASL